MKIEIGLNNGSCVSINIDEADDELISDITENLCIVDLSEIGGKLFLSVMEREIQNAATTATTTTNRNTVSSSRGSSRGNTGPKTQDSAKCSSFTLKGQKCKNNAMKNDTVCGKHKKVKKIVKTDEKCPICTDDITDIHTMNCCSQSFCKGCINTWLRENRTCPLCRENC